MSNQPNILFILSDQHRFSDVGYAGNAQVRTPYLDALAREGAVLEHAYSNCPVCVPARGSLLTGLHAFGHGAASNDIPVRPDCYSVARALREGGYRTAYVGKWHLGGVPRDRFIPEEERLGFEYWRGCNCNHDYMNAYYDDEDNVRHPIEGYEPIGQTNLALEYLLRSRSDERPWALFLCFGTPHDPYLRMPEAEAARCAERSQGIALRNNVRAYSEFDYAPPEGHHAFLRPGESEPDFERYFRLHKPSADTLRLDYAGYYRHIESIDEQIGRMLHWLSEDHCADNTLVVYTSDHGNMLGSHGLINKQWYHEESVHIPFVARWPGRIAPGTRTFALGLVDVMPTLLGLAGVACAQRVHGRDLSRALLDPAKETSNLVYLYSIIPSHQAWRREVYSWRAVADGHAVYAANEDASPLALYDLDRDPFELNNLAGGGDPREAALAAQLAEQVARYDGFLPWQKLTDRMGLREKWDASQRHFGYPAIRPDELH